ncbi:MAG: hypothetical protein Q9191_002715 [Dirinaria sp. TL-2023a]
MSTQYDSIGASYDSYQKLPNALLTQYNVETSVSPYVKGAKVLDLACGSGHYSNRMLEMGAEKVVGVDISPVMIDVARVKYTSDQISFHVHDCSKPRTFEGGPFDLVLAVWLLSYAPNGVEMGDMFRTIAMNLTNGGRFVGITPPPTNEPLQWTEKLAEIDPEQYGGVASRLTGEVEDGAAVRVIIVAGPKNIEFDSYHLRKSVYETAGRVGGMNGKVIWRSAVLPDNSEDSWHRLVEKPHFSLMEVSKE